MKHRTVFWIVTLYFIVVFSGRLYPQDRIITDNPFYATFDIIHFKVFLDKSPEVYYAAELIDVHGKVWGRQKLKSRDSQLDGSLSLDYHLPTGFYWIRVYPAAFYGETAPVLYKPLVIVNAEDLDKDQWKNVLQKVNGTPGIYFLTENKHDRQGGSVFKIGVIDEAGKIISGGASIYDNTNKDRFDLMNSSNGLFTGSFTPETGHIYRIIIKEGKNDSLAFEFSKSSLKHFDLSYFKPNAGKETVGTIRIDHDRNIYMPGDSVHLQISDTGKSDLDYDSGMLVLVSESNQYDVTFNSKPVIIISKKSDSIDSLPNKDLKMDSCFCLRGNYINPSTGTPRSNYSIALIGLGEKPSISFTHADKNGDFTFDASNWPENNSVYISTIGQPVEGLTYSDNFFRNFSEQPIIDFGNDDFAPLDSFITESKIRSVLHFQYLKGRSGTPRNAEQILYDTTKIYQKPDVSYDLNDYIQFNDVADIIHNILIYVHLTNNKKGDRLIIFNNQNPGLNKNPLYLINGIPTRDLQLVLSLNVKDIQKIDLLYNVNTIKPFGIAGLGGIMAIYTTQNVEIPNTIKVNLQGLHKQDGIYVPEREEGIPDFSPVLYWDPQYASRDQKQNVSFRLNNLISDMKINVFGKNSSGKLIRDSVILKIGPEK